MKLFQPIQGSIESKETQENLIDRGQLQVNVTSSVNAFPVKEARISISYTGIPESILEQVVTDSSGQTELVELNAPPEEWSLDENEERQPYSEYTLNIEAEGFESISVSGTEILANTKAIQNIRMKQKDQSREEEQVFVIPAHTLYGNYPPKIAEEEIKPVNETGEIVLSRVVVPEYIIVHDGSPRDSTAQNYYVKYKDYIKNVASSEIYATWPADTIRANVLAIMSFTLNRVYTEWYRNKGFDFTITSSTAFDHKWIYGRNIFDSISRIVDELFENYLSRPDVGEQGFSPIEILRYYYGDDMYINTAEAISGIPSSWPGYTLEQGSQGPKVRQIQEELNVIAGAYPEIPKLTEDGIYGPETEAAVRKFQSIFGLPVTGEIDYKTWYKISEIYVGVSRIAELS